MPVKSLGTGSGSQEGPSKWVQLLPTEVYLASSVFWKWEGTRREGCWHGWFREESLPTQTAVIPRLDTVSTWVCCTNCP